MTPKMAVEDLDSYVGVESASPILFAA